jgi:hypothetical protein
MQVPAPMNLLVAAALALLCHGAAGAVPAPAGCEPQCSHASTAAMAVHPYLPSGRLVRRLADVR